MVRWVASPLFRIEVTSVSKQDPDRTIVRGDIVLCERIGGGIGLSVIAVSSNVSIWGPSHHSP